jgi:hypothetical protein
MYFAIKGELLAREDGSDNPLQVFWHRGLDEALKRKGMGSIPVDYIYFSILHFL